MDKELLELTVGNLNDFHKDLEMFLGARLLTSEVKRKLLKFEKKINEKVYRGLPFPKHLIKIGNIIEEWYGSTHWTLDKKIATDFTTDYINEDYIEELEAELNREVEIKQVVLYMEGITGVESYKLLEFLNEKTFQGEKEISVFDSDFKIEEIEIKDNIYHIRVSEINSRIN